jgi:hypothetical protein
MVNLKNMSTKFFVTNTFRRVITIVGCLLFVFSFIYPFYYVSSEFGGTGARTHYWSFEDNQYWSADLIGSGSSHLWFFNYWFNPNLSVGVRISWMLISLFIVQVLTLVFGVAFIVCNKRALSFVPILLSIIVLSLMTYTATVISRNGLFFSNQYQLGYYLVYPSVALFVFAFALNEVVKKRQTASRDTSIPVKPQT